MVSFPDQHRECCQFRQEILGNRPRSRNNRRIDRPRGVLRARAERRRTWPRGLRSFHNPGGLPLGIFLQPGPRRKLRMVHLAPANGYRNWIRCLHMVKFSHHRGSSSYLQSLASLLIVVFSCLLVFLLFLIFTKIPFYWLLLILIPVMIYGFYLNYDLRRMVNERIM